MSLAHYCHPTAPDLSGINPIRTGYTAHEIPETASCYLQTPAAISCGFEIERYLAFMVSSQGSRQNLEIATVLAPKRSPPAFVGQSTRLSTPRAYLIALCPWRPADKLAPCAWRSYS
jgi:hypothetical protein